MKDTMGFKFEKLIIWQKVMEFGEQINSKDSFWYRHAEFISASPNYTWDSETSSEWRTRNENYTYKLTIWLKQKT